MTESFKPDQKLTGWKEIAKYLGVSVRTAQNFEEDRGLPVRRRGGLRTPVYAMASELDAWHKTAFLEPAITSTSEPRNTLTPIEPTIMAESSEAVVDDGAGRATPATKMDRRQWILSIAAGSATAGFTAWELWRAYRIRQTPAAGQIVGDTLSVIGRDGSILWRYTFSRPLFKPSYEGPPEQWCRFADVDGDGRPETVFVFSDGSTSSLWCFDASGHKKWVYSPGRTITDKAGRSFTPPYCLRAFEIIPSPPDHRARIVISSCHNWSFPNQVSILDGLNGQPIGEYWHRGHLWHMAVADLDGDGAPEILLGGVNDAPEFKQATVVVLDPRRVFGSSNDPDNAPYFQGMATGAEKNIIFFPRTVASQGEEFNRVTDVRISPARIMVSVAEGIDERSPSVIYEFTYSWKPTNTAFAGELVQRYKELQARGDLPKGDLDFNVLASELGSKVRVI